jgi:hypothetical protein
LGARLAPAYGDDNFKAITRRDHHLSMCAFRDDFAIAFNSDTFASKTKLGNKCGNREGAG